MRLPIEINSKTATEKVAEVRPGQMFVIVNTKDGGKWFDDILYDNVNEADRVVEAHFRRGVEGLQVMDAVWYAPAERKLRALGMRSASLGRGTPEKFKDDRPDGYYLETYEGADVGWEPYYWDRPMTKQEAEAAIQRYERRRTPWRLELVKDGYSVMSWKGGPSEEDVDHGDWLRRTPRGASEQQAEKYEAEAEANEQQAQADRAKADAARMNPRRARLTWAAEAKEKYPWDECIADQMDQYGNKETAEKVCGKIKAQSQGKSAADDELLKKAFVPDSVDGWLEWEDGSRTAASKTAGRKVTIEAEDGGYIVYLHGIRRITGLTPPVPLRQAEEIASIVRNYPKNYTAEQIGSELHRSFFASRTAASAPKEIHEVAEMEGLTGPIDFESEGEENIYFTDGYGKRYFFKYDGRERDAKRIRRYFSDKAPVKRRA